jgi:cytosine/adenosine deaminase-related metal-dependent hydrolase/predicted negative regulator of RcsB-dependent stress response
MILRKIALTLCFVILFACCICAQQTQTSPASDRSLVIRDVSLIDGTGAPLQTEMTIVIHGNHIEAIGKSSKVHIPQAAQVIDGRGKFLIPGLWDMHVHWNDTPYLPLFLANGVTGIRLMWGFPEHWVWRQKIVDKLMTGPRLSIASGIFDGPIPIWPGSISVKDAQEAREAVDLARKTGADFIKVYTLLPRDAYFAIANETKKLGIPFAGHVPYSVTEIEASEAGQKSIEHLTGMLLAASTREDEFRKEYNDAGQKGFEGLKEIGKKRIVEILDSYSDEKAARVFSAFKKNGTWQCPTLTVLRSFGYLNDPTFTNDPRLKYMPPSIRDYWNPKSDFRLSDRTDQDYENSRRSYQKSLQIVDAMNQAGVRILAGTDTLNPYCFPGFSLHDELVLLTQAGLTHMQALQTATRNAAEYLGQLDSLGTIEPHKLADLVLLSANPLVDIHNTTAIEAVVSDGNYFSKADLTKMLSNVEAYASRKSISGAISITLKQKGIEAAVKRYQTLKETQPDEYDFSEAQLDSLGSELLEQKQYDRAIAIFKLNTEAYPQSAFSFDSLAGAYLAHGDRDLAIQNYKKSLELNPQNGNAIQKLKELGVSH